MADTFPVLNDNPVLSRASSMSSYNPSSGSGMGQNSDGTITQIERLYTTRSRGSALNTNSEGDRGTRAYIRLLSNKGSATADRVSTEGFGNGQLSEILTGKGNPLDDALNGNSQFGGYSDFLITAVRCSLDEKLQITQTFGDGEVAYYFGRQPLFFTISGLVTDSVDNDWFTKWITMYGQVLRGSQLAKNYELIDLVLPNMELIGSISHMAYDQDSSNDVLIRFEFQFLAKQVIPTPIVGYGRPLTNDAYNISFTKAAATIDQTGINSLKSQTSAVLSAIQNPGSTLSSLASALSGFGMGMSGSYGGRGIGPGMLSPPGRTGLSDAIDGITANINGVASTVRDVFFGISTNLAGIRAAIFSPIYGVLTSLTKLIQSVLGDIASVFNSIVSPVMDVIRDINNIYSQAMGLVNLVTSISHDPMGILSRLTVGRLGNLNHLLNFGQGFGNAAFSGNSLLNSAGVISTQPWTASMTLRELVNSGRISGSSGYMANTAGGSTLSSSSAGLSSKSALLNSGPAPTAEAGAVL